MATTNPFDLLGDEDAEDPSQLIQKAVAAAPALPKKPAPAVQAKPAPEQLQTKPPPKLPSKPLPPAQAGELLDSSSFRCVLLGFYFLFGNAIGKVYKNAFSLVLLWEMRS